MYDIVYYVHLCSFCCGCSVYVNNCARLSYRKVTCAFADVSFHRVFGYMVLLSVEHDTFSASAFHWGYSDDNGKLGSPGEGANV